MGHLAEREPRLKWLTTCSSAAIGFLLRSGTSQLSLPLRVLYIKRGGCA